MLLALPLYHSSNLHLRCLFRLNANYDMGPPQVGFCYKVEPPKYVYIICLVSVLVPAFCFQVPCQMLYSPMGAQLLGFVPLHPFGAYPWQAYVQPGDGHWPTTGMYRVAAPSPSLCRGSLMLLNLLFPNHPNYMVGHTAFGTRQSHPITLPFLNGGEGSSFPGLVPSDDMTLNLQ